MSQQAKLPSTAEIGQALERGEINAWYQPMIDLASGKAIGVEALARWVPPVGPARPTSDFIPVAENSDLIVELDHRLMRQALGDLRMRWPAGSSISLNLNLSGRTLDQEDCAPRVLETIREQGVEPGRVVLELTETRSPVDLGQCATTLHALREGGCRVWFDDFGSGWSALQHLLNLPVDGIKLDWTYSGVLRTKLGDDVVRDIAHAAKALGLVVAIEGVETVAQATRARELGCQMAQGFLWGAAVPGPQPLLSDQPPSTERKPPDDR